MPQKILKKFLNLLKKCSPYVRELERIFMLERAERYQLLLSTIKQLRVIDLLDELPIMENKATKNAKIFFKNIFVAIILLLF